MKKALITGSSGLVGSEAVLFFEQRGFEVIGIDNNMRKYFFGQDGDTTWNLKRLKSITKHFIHMDLDIRDRNRILDLFKQYKFDVIIHCAAQPSHDWAAREPFTDFDINAVGTLNLIEACRQTCKESPFIFMSTNKVYGDAPNRVAFKEMETRWEFADESMWDGFTEDLTIDGSTHSIFGASKVAADVMTQEYGRYFGMPTVSFRGGCLTGPAHSGAELHGFIAYLVKAALNGITYTVYGYKGKQVRDNIHSTDVLTAFWEYYKNPKPGAVYNLGGGRENSTSILEMFDRLERLTGKKINRIYNEKNRLGDHICYISNMRQFRKDYPNWDISRGLGEITKEIVDTLGRNK